MEEFKADVCADHMPSHWASTGKSGTDGLVMHENVASHHLCFKTARGSNCQSQIHAWCNSSDIGDVYIRDEAGS